MDAFKILSALVLGGLSPVGACALGGNMLAESGMQSSIAQRGMTRLTDEQYTAAADAGTIDFARDGVGYGLCQWTYPTRKAGLLSFAAAQGVSVGDEDMQVRFCLGELRQDYPALYTYLKSTKLLYEAAGKVCTEYERPAVNNISLRADKGSMLYMQHGEALEKLVRARETGSTDSGVSAQNMYDVSDGRSPEAKYLSALLELRGYDVLWLGLEACLADFRQKAGITGTGIGEKTWSRLRKTGTL